MTIDEAIAKYKNKAEEHEQIAEWLEELKAIKSEGFTDDLLNMGFTKGYNKAIDDFLTEICKMIVQSENNGNYRFYTVEIKQSIADLSEQLKRKGVTKNDSKVRQSNKGLV